MAYNIKNMWVPQDKYQYKCPYTMNPTHIAVHNTGNTASAKEEATYMVNNNNYVSYHVVIDENDVYQCIPFNRNAFHTGDGTGATSGNRTAIGVEIARSMDNGYSGAKSTRYIQAENNAIEYIAHVLVERGWGVSKVKQHFDYSGKDCPHKIRAHGDWNNFISKISKKVNEIKYNKIPTISVKKKAPVKTKPKTTVKSVLSGKKHIVKAGDTLWDLAIKYKVTVGELKSWNELKSDRIFIDMVLFVEKPTKKKAVVKQKAPVKKTTSMKSTINNSKNNFTYEQAIKFINGLDGNMYDTDRYAGAQCFDLANVYWLAMYGHSLKGEGAKDIPTWNDFTGEAKVYNNTPEFLAKAGDLVVWFPKGGSGYGHVAIVVAADLNSITVVEQNWLGGGKTMSEYATIRKHNYEFPMWFIRPTFR